MQRLFSLLLPLALASGCALAQAPRAIEDVEPEVTQQVAAAVAKMAVDPAAEGAALLRACAAQAAPPLELLRRTVDGEERTYLYRTQCGKPLLVSATYGKNGAIKRLQLKAE
ncbi:hypothetical protein [Duganella sp. HH101]|uniref:hypothetical protein n=1 Tax=Duganella sp. HH101 TaxID=1781066 RepID=UPI000873BD99|nr:hypothetical protein [Duganella sp. HH101]OFA02340.1 hypothetical protein DUGA2_36840 [Duganella sp. HH101]